MADFASDPIGHPLDTPSGLIELVSERYELATGFPALPTWRGREMDPAHPLCLITPKRADRTHSQGGDRSSSLGPSSHELQMHPSDALRRGLGDGGAARVFNERGKVHVQVRVSTDIMPGVVSLNEGIWFDLDEKGEDRAGSANLLTGTEGTGPDNSCIMHDIAVEVAP